MWGRRSELGKWRACECVKRHHLQSTGTDLVLVFLSSFTPQVRFKLDCAIIGIKTLN